MCVWVSLLADFEFLDAVLTDSLADICVWVSLSADLSVDIFIEVGLRAEISFSEYSYWSDYLMLAAMMCSSCEGPKDWRVIVIFSLPGTWETESNLCEEFVSRIAPHNNSLLNR